MSCIGLCFPLTFCDWFSPSRGCCGSHRLEGGKLQQNGPSGSLSPVSAVPSSGKATPRGFRMHRQLLTGLLLPAWIQIPSLSSAAKYACGRGGRPRGRRRKRKRMASKWEWGRGVAAERALPRGKVLGEPHTLVPNPSMKVNIQGQSKAALTHTHIYKINLSIISAHLLGVSHFMSLLGCAVYLSG